MMKSLILMRVSLGLILASTAMMGVAEAALHQQHQQQPRYNESIAWYGDDVDTGTGAGADDGTMTLNALRGSSSTRGRDLAGMNERCRWPAPVCPSNGYCTRAGKNSKCMPKKAAGEGCGEGRECASGFCSHNRCRVKCEKFNNCGIEGASSCPANIPPCPGSDLYAVDDPYCGGSSNGEACCYSPFLGILAGAVCETKKDVGEVCTSPTGLDCKSGICKGGRCRVRCNKFTNCGIEGKSSCPENIPPCPGDDLYNHDDPYCGGGSDGSACCVGPLGTLAMAECKVKKAHGETCNGSNECETGICKGGRCRNRCDKFVNCGQYGLSACPENVPPCPGEFLYNQEDATCREHINGEGCCVGALGTLAGAYCALKKEAGEECSQDKECKGKCKKGRCREVCEFSGNSWQTNVANGNCGKEGQSACPLRAPPCNDETYRVEDPYCGGSPDGEACCVALETLAGGRCVKKAKAFDVCEKLPMSDTCAEGVCKNTREKDANGKDIYRCLNPSALGSFKYKERRPGDVATCASFRIPNWLESSYRNDNTKAISSGFGASFFAGGTTERGVAYGADGCFSCFVTHCSQFELGVGLEYFVSTVLETTSQVMCEGAKVCSNKPRQVCSDDAECPGNGSCVICWSWDGKSSYVSAGADLPIGGGSVTLEFPRMGMNGAALADGHMTTAASYSIGPGQSLLGGVSASGGLCNTKHIVAGCLDENGENFSTDISVPPLCVIDGQFFDDISDTYTIDRSGGTTAVSLDASQSSDLDGTPFTYKWTVEAGNCTSFVSLTGDTTATPVLTLTTPSTGEYTVATCEVDLVLEETVGPTPYLNGKISHCGATVNIIDPTVPAPTPPAPIELVPIELSGTASQGSTCSGGVAQRANDGNLNQNFAGGSVTQTCGSQQSGTNWWRFDFTGGFSYVEKIEILGRADCCQALLNNATVALLDDSDVVLDFKYTGNNLDQQVLDFGIISGVYSVKITSDMQNKLELAEVRVVGYEG